MTTTSTHVYFYGGVFSNWYGCTFTIDGIEYNCSEQAYMYAKAIHFGDTDTAFEIMREGAPNLQKALGKLVKNYDDAEWSRVRYNKMVEILRVKFKIPELRKLLKLTLNRVIVEASPHDNIWGVGLSELDSRIYDEKNWTGQNLLGKTLMEVRDELAE